MKDYFMKFLGIIMYLLSYPYDICLIILTVLHLIATFLVSCFSIFVRGLVIIGHGANFEETLHFQDTFKMLSAMNDEIKNM